MKLFGRNLSKNKRIAAGLRGARSLMNNKGAHWIKGSLKTGGPKGPQFCLVGGVNEAFGIPQGDEAIATYDRKNAVVKRLSDRDYAVLCLACETDLPWEHTQGVFNGTVYSADSHVEHWNDHPNRTWDEVNEMLKLVARNIANGRYVVTRDDQFGGPYYRVTRRA